MENSYKDSIHILCVEDDEMNQMVLKMLLERLGYSKVSAAVNAQEAIALLEKPDTDINFILMDLGLPGINGLELTRKIRGSSWTVKNVPIVALTGNAEESAKKESLDAGMNDFLTKPVNADRLKHILENLIK